jgi:MFS transporter, DHA3 family, macrolide efflux protein
MDSELIATLRNPNYAKLLSGQVIAAFGDRINQTAILSIIINKLGSPGKYSADIMFWAILPAVVLGLFAIALIDRWNRQKVMIISDVGRALLVLSLPVLLVTIHHHYVIYSIVFLVGVFSAIFAPCRLAIMPNIMPQKLLMSANAVSSQAGTIGSLAIMPVAAWMIAKWGQNVCFGINAVTFLVSACFVWSLRVQPSEEAAPKQKPHPIEDFQTGLRYIWNSKPILFYVIFFALIQALVALFFPIFFEYTVQILGETEKGAVNLFLAVAVGMISGGIALTVLHKIREHFFLPMFMMIAAGLNLIFLSRIYETWKAAGLLFGVGASAIMIMVPLDTYLQKHVPDQLRGRVFTARGVLVGIVMLVCLQLSKALIFRLGALGALHWLGVGACLCAIMSALLVPWFRNSTPPLESQRI